MSIYAIADLHLSLSNPEKSMDVFGSGWNGYISHIKEAWEETVTSDDTVLVSGDISWATYIENAKEDFEFINSLPGRKLLSRGNHDYWWTTIAKMEKVLADWGFDSIGFVRTNAVECEGNLITGTRGWNPPKSVSDYTEEDKKIYLREIERTKIAIRELDKADPERERKRIFMIHFPPTMKDLTNTELSDLMDEGGIDICVYGHLHGRSHRFVNPEGTGKETQYICTSSDYLGFRPVKIL
ncbi:MAG: metallophosphoesterase [Clostridiales bacterium]|nr:metallophosphoesterase [Clostridiales bacterium]